MQVPPNTLAIWSDLGCPWSHAVVWRLHDARRRLGLEGRVRFDHHAFPLELFNNEATPRPRIEHARDRGLQRLEARNPVSRKDRRIAVVDDYQLGEGIDRQVHVPGCGLAASVDRKADLPGAEAGAGPVRNHVVHRRPDYHDVGRSQLGHIEHEGDLLEGGASGVGGL